MPDHDTLQQEESPDAQRKRIKAMAQDPEMQQVAATARARGPERSPQPATSGKKRIPTPPRRPWPRSRNVTSSEPGTGRTRHTTRPVPRNTAARARSLRRTGRSS